MALLDSGKYAAFVLAAYGVSALTLIVMTVESLLKARNWRRKAGGDKPMGEP